jgi:shikimate dehydrogenase
VRITASTATYAVIGQPIRHSRSPEIHNALFADHHLDAVYVAIEVALTDASALGAALRTLRLAGANLTVPFKEAVLGALDHVDGEAWAIGAVNTVVRDGERLIGLNTDSPGFLGSVRQAWGDVTAGSTAVVVGAGGAGRAVAAALADGGAAEVRIVNRTLARAESVAERLSVRWSDTRFVATDLEGLDAACAGAEVLVQAASAAGSRGLALPLHRLERDAVVVDVNYGAAAAPLVQAARDRQLRVMDGLPMLAWQAALAFRAFTGIDVDPGLVLDRLLRGSVPGA